MLISAFRSPCFKVASPSLLKLIPEAQPARSDQRGNQNFSKWVAHNRCTRRRRRRRYRRFRKPRFRFMVVVYLHFIFLLLSVSLERVSPPPAWGASQRGEKLHESHGRWVECMRYEVGIKAGRWEWRGRRFEKQIINHRDNCCDDSLTFGGGFGGS